MELYEGMKIKIFPDTEVEGYVHMIRDYGFNTHIKKDYIIVGKPLADKYDADLLGDLFYEKRRAKKMSKAALSEKIGVHKVTIADWEMGRRKPNKYNLNQMKIALDITEGELEKCLTRRLSTSLSE